MSSNQKCHSQSTSNRKYSTAGSHVKTSGNRFFTQFSQNGRFKGESETGLEDLNTINGEESNTSSASSEESSGLSKFIKTIESDFSPSLINAG